MADQLLIKLMVTLKGKRITKNPENTKILLTKFRRSFLEERTECSTCQRHNNTNAIKRQSPTSPLSERISK
jgi:hypothetical protein